MAIRFKNIVIPVDCARLDEREEVLVELTSRGDLTFHNFDRETALAEIELGFEIDDIPCLFIEQNWEFLSSDIRSVVNGRNDLIVPDITIMNQEFVEDAFPMALKKEMERVKGKIFDGALVSIKRSRYSTQIPISAFTNSTRIVVSIIGVNPNGKEFINANLKKRWNANDDSIYASIDIFMYLTIQSYMDVQNMIHDGIVLDRFSKKIAAVVAIDEIISDSKMIVRAGKQLADMTIRTKQALIEKKDKRGKTWVIEKWIQ